MNLTKVKHTCDQICDQNLELNNIKQCLNVYYIYTYCIYTYTCVLHTHTGIHACI